MTIGYIISPMVIIYPLSDIMTNIIMTIIINNDNIMTVVKHNDNIYQYD